MAYISNITLPTGKNILIKDDECRADLDKEIKRATDKEMALKNYIDDEMARAIDAEEKNTALINKEVSGLKEKDTEIETTIEVERDRAIKAETTLHNEFITAHHGNGTINKEYVESGTCSWVVIGRVCILTFNDVKFSNYVPSSQNVMIFTGLPKNTSYDMFGTISATNISPVPSPVTTRLLMRANETGVHVWYSSVSKTEALYNGQLIYFTDIIK